MKLIKSYFRMKYRPQVLQLNNVPEGLDYKQIKIALRQIKNEQGPLQIRGGELFFKKGEVWSNNSKEELLYQFKWLKQSREINGVNVPKPLAFLKIGDVLGYIMERINGKTLYELISTDKTNRIEDSPEIFKQIRKQINKLHGRGMYHGDIDLQNIILNNEGQVFLIDPYKHEEPKLGKLDDLKRLVEIEKNLAVVKR